MKLCMGCMEQYEDKYSLCPFCGYEENTLPEEAFHLTPGAVIGERYIVGKVLGFGGFGVTYIGFDRELEKKVAIKEYLPSEFATRTPNQTHVTIYGGDKQEQFGLGLKKFVDEARKLAKFSEDTEIVNVYDTFTENDTAYIIMEYLEGESLKELLERKGKLSVDETEKLLLPVFRSLKIVHDAGIIHRDIAPDNIFVTKEGKVKLLDFGAARYASATHSRSLTVMYKPGYAPEEQYQSHGDQGPWTDVYALAATMYKCITGITPDTSLERKAHETLKAPSKLGVSIPANKETALLNAMNIEIKSRTKSTEQFLNEWESKGKVARIVEKFSRMDAGRLSRKAKIGMITGAAILAASLAVVIGMGGVSKITDTIKIAQGNVRVPSMINKTIDDASVLAEDTGISLMQEDTRYDEEIEKGKILTQSIEAGLLMAKSDSLRIVVSGGIKQIYVPDITGNTKEKAVSALEKEGFRCSIEEEYSSVAVGNVIRTNLAAGTQHNNGMEIVIYVSKGIDPATIQTADEPIEYMVEDYTGMTIEEVLLRLAEFGIYLDYSEQMESEEVEKNHIVTQRTSEGTRLTAGDTVYVVVSNGIPVLNVGSVIGWQYEGKKQELEEIGFFVEKGEERYDDASVQGLILAVMTETGEPVTDGMALQKGTKLICTVSKGPKPVVKATATPKPTATSKPTATPKPTATSKPTSTPKPTATSKPTVTSKPTATPRPTITPKPTATVKPTPTLAPVHVHNYTASYTVTKYPTCTTSGNRAAYCSCGEYIMETIPMYGHTAVSEPAVAATCTEVGKTEGSRCSSCGYVLIAQQEVAAKGHTEVTDPAVAATCTEKGKTEGKHCSVCHEVLIAQQEVAAKGHTEVSILAKAATCTGTGLTEGKKCSVCGTVTVAQQEVAAKGHTEESIHAVAATCTGTGLTEGKKCSVCGTVTVPQQEVAAKGHTEESIPAVAATCTGTGLTEGKKCSVCGTVTVPQQEVAAKGHNSDATILATSATCTATGLTEGKKCSVCGTVTVAQQATQALGHVWDNESDQNCNRCNEYRAVWHYYDQWDNNSYGDWELYDTQSETAYNDVTVTTYQYINYYFVESGQYLEKGYCPSGYSFNKTVTKTKNTQDGGVGYLWYGTTTGGSNSNTTITNKKYNMATTPIMYERAQIRSPEGWLINGLIYYYENVGSEVKRQEYTRYHYFFRKFY